MHVASEVLNSVISAVLCRVSTAPAGVQGEAPGKAEKPLLELPFHLPRCACLSVCLYPRQW